MKGTLIVSRSAARRCLQGHTAGSVSEDAVDLLRSHVSAVAESLAREMEIKRAAEEESRRFHGFQATPRLSARHATTITNGTPSALAAQATRTAEVKTIEGANEIA